MEYFQDSHRWRLSKRSERDLETQPINLEQCGGRTICMSMSNDIDWTKHGHSLDCTSNSKEVSDYAKRFQRGHWSFLGLGEEDKWCVTYSYKPEGKWNGDANLMIEHFRESGHPIFRGLSAFNRGISKKKGGRSTIYFSDNSVGKSAQFLRSSIELVWRISRVQHRMWTSLFQERTTSYRKSWIRKKWIC